MLFNIFDLLNQHHVHINVVYQLHVFIVFGHFIDNKNIEKTFPK